MRLVQCGPTGDTDNLVSQSYSAGESNTGLPGDYSMHYRRLSNLTEDFRYDVSMRGRTGVTVTTTTPIDRVWIRITRFPSTEQGLWLNGSDSHPAAAAGLITCSTTGLLRFYYKGNSAFPGTLIGVVGQTVIGQWHELIVYSYFTSPLNVGGTAMGYVYGDKGIFGTGNSPPCQVYFDRALACQGSVLDSSNPPNSNPWACFRSVVGRLEATGTAFDLDWANLLVDDATTPSVASRISPLRVAAVGTYQTWGSGGLANYQARNAWPGSLSAVATTTGLQTVTAGQKQTYLLESFAAAGITGTLYSAAVHIAFPEAPATAPTLLVLRNGVETGTLTWAIGNGNYLTYRLDTTGWALGDTIELGVQASVGTTRIAGILLTVEHDTPVPAITLGDIDSTTTSWVGNGTAQSLAAPLDAPSWIFYWPRGGVFQAGGWWMDGANTHQTFTTPGTLRANLIVRGGSLDLIGNGADSPNDAGKTYDALVIRDPKMRMLGRGTYAETTNVLDDDYPVAMVDPFGAVFAPTTLWAGRQTTNTNTLARYYGPGMAGDAAVPLSAGAAPAADFIEALTATGFTAGVSLNNVLQQVAYSGFRKGIFTTTILMDSGSYLGDGTAAQVIPTLTGAVKWAFVWPQNGTAPVLRNDQLASGNLFTSGGGASPTTITALGVGSFTVGLNRNTLGVTYSWLVFGYGNDPAPVVPPSPGDGCSDPLAAGSDSGGGLGCKALLAAGTDSVGGVGCKAALA